MDVVRILRLLWRLRLSVAVGVALAVLVGILFAFRVGSGLPPKFESRQYVIGVASASVLFDSQSSQVSDLGDPEVSAGPGVLSARAQLLANLLATSPLKEQVAARARVSPKRLITQLSSSDPNQPVTAPETTGATVSPDDPAAYILDVTINHQVPIITFNAQAPSPRLAARISNAAVTELRGYLDDKASTDGVPEVRKLVVEPLGAAESSTLTRGPTRLTAIGAAIFVVAFWCVCILGIDGLARSWRDTEAGASPGSAISYEGDTSEGSASPTRRPIRKGWAVRTAAASLLLPERPVRLDRPERIEGSGGAESSGQLDWADSPERPKPGMVA